MSDCSCTGTVGRTLTGSKLATHCARSRLGTFHDNRCPCLCTGIS